MKLFTHNILTSRHLKGVKLGYPLKLTATETKNSELDYNPDFLKRMLTRLDWTAFRSAAESVGVQVPESVPKVSAPFAEAMDTDTDKQPEGGAATSSSSSSSPPSSSVPQFSDEDLKRIHHVLMEVEVVTGTLECPETGRQFTITDGIPNMIAREDEI